MFIAWSCLSEMNPEFWDLVSGVKYLNVQQVRLCTADVNQKIMFRIHCIITTNFYM